MLSNLIVGIGAHSSTYPCCYCESSPKEQWNTAPLRTFGRIRELESERRAAERGGTVPSDPRFYKSVQHEPLIDCHDETIVLEKVPPPELHLLMGVINHIYRQMQQVSVSFIFHFHILIQHMYMYIYRCGAMWRSGPKICMYSKQDTMEILSARIV